ncbi:hypothetical protein [Actinomadura opuntiae]|uniref:hypothetical protein n=1 Tax=Actinomadura sp. OS1-43 TaxID=604315 RepID=UPI00255AD621|nr:hypothetical protein [Actinomadura sp. OS1-43]MDL4820871.1 hypothetical protein [Actinomadura sp. OS1-43]
MRPCGLEWRTGRRATATHHLDLLAVAVLAKGYRFVKLYRAEELPARPLLLWVFAFGRGHRHVRVAVGVRVTTGDAWGYYVAGLGGHRFLSPCGDVDVAAARVDAVLKHRMFPSTW